MMARKEHVIVIAFPAQGHVGPLMKLAYKLADGEVQVTFVSTESVHTKLISAIPDKFKDNSPIKLVSIPEGLESDNDWKDRFESGWKFMADHLRKFIEEINGSEEDDQITHVIADISVWWAIDLSKKMGIKTTAFVPYGLSNFALVLHTPKLIEDGIIDVNGIPLKNDIISLSKEIPAWKTDGFPWSIRRDPEIQKFLFRSLIFPTIEYVKVADFLLVNSASELEKSACDLIPNALTIGPIGSSNHLELFAGNLWAEDSTCLTWLDQQPDGSVIYVAFGSSTFFNQQQLNELAIGLESTGQPFLWVVRSDITQGPSKNFPDGFLERTGNQGKIVEWAPQEKVLAHPAISCFVSHCGWNSTMEGVRMGVPFACWPYGVDQYHNKQNICENWKIGVELNPDENEIVTSDGFKRQIQKLVSDKDIKLNSRKLKEMARKSTAEGGSSFHNFLSFLQQIKKC